MSKDQKETKKLHLENVERLITSCKMIKEIRSGLRYWKFDQIWPTNLYDKTLSQVVDLLNAILLSNDFSNESVMHYPVTDKK